MPDYDAHEALSNSDLKTYDNIEVFIEEIYNNTTINSYNLNSYTGNDNPYLQNAKNPLYFFKARLRQDCSYKLNLITPTATDTITATTDIIGKLTYFFSQQQFVDFSTDEKRAIVRWRAPENATIFILSFKFDYYEIQQNDTSLCTVRKILFDDRFRSYDDDEPLVTVITGKVFYDMIKENLEIKNNVIRVATSPKFEINMGGEELYDIIISAAMKDLDYPIYENGQYSNVTNGQGIFTSVYDTTISLHYNSKTLDTLASRNDIKAYNFQNYILYHK